MLPWPKNCLTWMCLISRPFGSWGKLITSKAAISTTTAAAEQQHSRDRYSSGSRSRDRGVWVVVLVPSLGTGFTDLVDLVGVCIRVCSRVFTCFRCVGTSVWCKTNNWPLPVDRGKWMCLCGCEPNVRRKRYRHCGCLAGEFAGLINAWERNGRSKLGDVQCCGGEMSRLTGGCSSDRTRWRTMEYAEWRRM